MSDEAPNNGGGSPPEPPAPPEALPTTDALKPDAPKEYSVAGIRFLTSSPKNEPKTPLWMWLAVGLGGTLLVFVVARVAGSSLNDGVRPLSAPVAPQADAPRPPLAPSALFTVTAHPIGDTPPAVPPEDVMKAIREFDGGHPAGVHHEVVKKRPANKNSFPTPSLAVEAASAALDAKDSARALAILDQLDKDFGPQLSDADAKALRIEALGQAHRDTEALKLCDQFLEDYPHSPQADRVKAIQAALQKRQQK